MPRPGRSGRRGRRVEAYQNRRVDDLRREAALSHQDAGTAAREAPRTDRSRAAPADALPRFDLHRGRAPPVHPSCQDRPVDSQLAVRTRLCRSRGAYAALGGRRRGGAPLQDASQRAGHAALATDRAGVAPQAIVGGRHRAGLRAWAAYTATKASASGTIPSSRCSKFTRPTATMAR